MGSISSILILYFLAKIVDILPIVSIIAFIASIIGIGGAICIKFHIVYSGIILIISSIRVLYGFSMNASFITTVFNSI